jgi:hypothetical protein
MTCFSEINIKINAIKDKIVNFVGLQSFIELFKLLKLNEIIEENIHASGTKGYTDVEIIQALVTMQIAGGDALDHLDYCKGVLDTGPSGIKIPSPSTARAYLNGFDNEEESKQRGQGKAFIPQENENLAGFSKVHFALWEEAYALKPEPTITLDQDATFINTESRNALFNYHGERAYEAFNTYCPESDMIVATQFRDGNVPPSYRQFEEFKRVLENVPAGVKKVQLRSDSAGYQTGLLKYCASGENERFGVIDFAISCPMVKELKEAAKQAPEKEWQTVYVETPKGLKATNQEWAEVAYVSNELSSSEKSAEYRFFVTREKVEITSKEQAKLHTEETQLELPLEETIEKLEKSNENLKKLHLTEMGGKVYKIYAIVSDVMDKEGGELIRWHRGRCGKSEEVHHILKEELAGGHVVSQNFGANAAYWNIAVLALSLHSLMKQHVLPKKWSKARPQTLRFVFYSTAGLLVTHARKVTLKVSGYIWHVMMEAQRRLRELRKKLSVQTS